MFSISNHHTECSAKWGLIGATTIGAVFLAKKVHAYFTENFLDTTKRYLEFINRIGQGETFKDDKIASSLLTTDCKKVLNGQLFKSNRNDFISDLYDVHKKQGSWTVSPLDIIDAPASKCVTLRLLIEMKTAGQFTAIVILRFNSSNLITEINEVMSKVEGSYNFQKKSDI